MAITFLGQAGLFTETRWGSILCDRWFNSACFASWFPFPDNGKTDRAKRGRPNYLYISHLHYDPDFQRGHVWKEPTHLLSDHPLDIMEPAPSEVGFTKFIKAKNTQVVGIDGLRSIKR